MSRVGIAPIDLSTVGTTFNVNLPGAIPELNAVRFGNDSSLTLAWQWGDQEGYLYSKRVEPLKPRGVSGSVVRFTVQPSSLGQVGTLFIELAFRPDDFTGDPTELTGSSVVQITGTPAVTISGTPAVTISGTPTVTISGNVTFSNTQIQVLNVAGNLLNTNQIPTSLGSWAVTGVAGTVVSQIVTVPSATHAIQVACTVDVAVTIRGTTTNCYYSKNRFATVSTLVGLQGPVATFEIPINTGIETGYEIRITKNDGAAGTAFGAAVLTSECVTAKTDIGDPLRVASRLDHQQNIENTGTGVALSVGVWTQLLATASLDTNRQIQQITVAVVNGSGVTQTVHWRVRGSISGQVVTIHQAIFNTVEYARVVNFDPHLFWGRLNQLAWANNDIAIFDCFINGASCAATFQVVYLLG